MMKLDAGQAVKLGNCCPQERGTDRMDKTADCVVAVAVRSRSAGRTLTQAAKCRKTFQPQCFPGGCGATFHCQLDCGSSRYANLRHLSLRFHIYFRERGHWLALYSNDLMHQAIEFYEQNLQLAREMGDRRGELSALGSLARAYAALNERNKAIEYFELSLKIARSMGDTRNERYLLKHLSAALNADDGKPEDQTQLLRKPRKKKEVSAIQSASDPFSQRKKNKSRAKKMP